MCTRFLPNSDFRRVFTAFGKPTISRINEVSADDPQNVVGLRNRRGTVIHIYPREDLAAAAGQKWRETAAGYGLNDICLHSHQCFLAFLQILAISPRPMAS